MNTEQSKNKSKSRAVFLDRDGTVCEDVNYLSNPEQLKLFPFAGEAIRLLNETDFLVILITNQSGIARGFFDENALHKIHEKLAADLAESGAKLDAIYFCPHNSENNCDCRKPKIGMIQRAIKDFAIDLQASWMIGDKAIDVETGINAKTKTALVLTGYGQSEIENLNGKPDIVAENLMEAVRIITNDAM